MIDVNAKTKEEIIPFLLKLGFVFMHDSSSYYSYDSPEYTILVDFEILEEGGKLLELVYCNNINREDEAYCTDEYAIDMLNAKFKYKLRKMIIKKLLKE